MSRRSSQTSDAATDRLLCHASPLDMQPLDMQDVPTLLATLGLAIAALSTICSLLSHFCRCSRAHTAPLHLQEDLLEVVPPPGLGVTLLPSIGRSISHGLVASLCYMTALATLVALGLGAEASAAVALVRSKAFLLLGGSTESELWQGIRDSDDGFWRPQLWRLRAALRCCAAALLCAAWLSPLCTSGDAPPFVTVVLGAVAALIALAHALLVGAGASSPVESATPPPPLRTALLLPKLLYTFWAPEVRRIVAIDQKEGGAPLSVDQLPQLDPAQRAVDCWQRGAPQRARREAAVRAAATRGDAAPSKACRLLPELWHVVKMDVKVQLSWAAFCLCSQYAAPGGMLLLISYVGDYVDGPIAPKAFAFGALVAFGPLCSAVSDAHTFANGWLLGTKLRGYLAHAISHKALRLDASATEQSTGQMVNDPPPPRASSPTPAPL